MGAAVAYEDSEKQYFKEVTHDRLLPHSTQLKLIRQSRHGDEAARARVLEANLLLVVKEANKYRNRGLPVHDLVSAGNFGLVEAWEKYKVSKGVSYAWFAVHYVRKRILEELAWQSRTVRVPEGVHDDMTKVRERARELVQAENLSGKVALRRALVELDVSQETADLERQASAVMSLDQPYGDKGKGTLGDCLRGRQPNPYDVFEAHDGTRLLDAAFERYKTQHPDDAERDLRILDLFYGLHDNAPHTKPQIAALLHISRSRVLQLRDRAVERMRSIPEMKSLDELLR